MLTQNFKEVEIRNGVSVRHRARNLALDALALKQRFVDGRDAIYRPRVQFLFFHHVFQDELENFELLVRELAEVHTFISHTEAVDRLLSGNVDRPYISWSSDDGFLNNLQAAEILERYGAKACFFLNPSSIGMTDHQKITAFCDRRLNMPPIAFLDWRGVEALLKNGHEIGAHTVHHQRVTEMSLSQFGEDLELCKEQLEEKCGPVHHFAYPYGRYFDFYRAAHELVFQKGYSSCSSGERGCHVSNGERIKKEALFIRRDQVIAAWKREHMKFFIVSNAAKAVYEDNFLPPSL